MKFTCSNIDFLDSALSASKASSSATSFPILEGVLVEAKDNVIITGNNLQISIENKFSANIYEQGSVVVDAKMLCEILRRMPEGTVVFETVSEGSVNIKCNDMDFNINSLPADDFPKMPAADIKEEIEIMPSVISEIVKRTSFATAQTELKPLLTGIKLEVNDDIITAVALDGYRMAIANIENNNNFQQKSYVIPGRSLSELDKLTNGMDKAIKMYIGDKNVLFEFETCRFFSRLLEGQYIDYKQLIPPQYSYSCIINTTEFIRSVDRASLITGSDGSKVPIKIAFSGDKITVSCEAKQGNFKDNIAVKSNGSETVEIGFNYKFLIDALRAANDEFVKVSIVNPLKPVAITPVEGEKYLFIVVPVKLK